MIDGHIDLPILVREFYGNNLSSFDLENETVCGTSVSPAPRADGSQDTWTSLGCARATWEGFSGLCKDTDSSL